MDGEPKEIAPNIKKEVLRLRKFFSSGVKTSYARKSVIIKLEDDVSRAFWITEGYVKVYSYDSYNEERMHHIYKKDELFPISRIFGKILPGVVFSAFTDTKLLSKPIPEVLKFFDEYPSTLLAVVRQQISVFDKVLLLSLGRADEKVAYSLLVLAERLGEKVNGYITLELPLTIQELSKNVGLSRETTGKILNRFEKHRLILLSRQMLIVFPEQLGKMLNDQE